MTDSPTGGPPEIPPPPPPERKTIIECEFCHCKLIAKSGEYAQGLSPEAKEYRDALSEVKELRSAEAKAEAARIAALNDHTPGDPPPTTPPLPKRGLTF